MAILVTSQTHQVSDTAALRHPVPEATTAVAEHPSYLMASPALGSFVLAGAGFLQFAVAFALVGITLRSWHQLDGSRQSWLPHNRLVTTILLAGIGTLLQVAGLLVLVLSSKGLG